ncbi:MAG: dihydroorotate dehydrogenase [Clostridiales bacterium]|nr:dihydroorotate dehydrogenase [Clostridiales bacterium]
MNLRTNLAGVVLENPVMNASGTFSRESAEYTDVNKMGAVVTKGVSLEPWSGNPPPRIAETHGGMLNAVGLQNPGVEYFLREELPFWKKFHTKIIVNIVGKTPEEYMAVAERLRDADVDMLELNISCPNIKEGGIAIGTCAKQTERVTSAVKNAAKQPLIVKLSPNVTDIVEIAKAAEAGGADALSLINTLLGMRIDVKTRRPLLGNIFGGLSGPAIKPVALRMVYQVCGAVKIPVIGMGGVSNATDALEFLMAGASAVAVGSANFTNPRAIDSIIKELAAFCVDEVRGAARI